jgi:multidrug efflux pump subunit AcrA (membrane-fusion protein)
MRVDTVRRWLAHRTGRSVKMAVASLVCLLAHAARAQEPVISKDTISVHRIERGNMPLRQIAAGHITALMPPTAIVTVMAADGERCEVGRPAAVQFAPPRTIMGKVTKVSRDSDCEIEFSEAFPDNITVGAGIRSLIETGDLANVVFFDRPADSVPNSQAAVFLVEPDGHFARRVTVRYGKMSGPQIQVVEGLSPGDRVIVTDMSKWLTFERVRLQ